MGIFNFIKKIFSEPEKAEQTREKIYFSDIEKFINKRINDLNAKENEVISLIKEKINTFTGELNEKIKIAGEVDIESREKNDRIKSAVNEGRKKYIEFLERFIENIENPGGTKSDRINLEKITEEINSAFLRFNENSGKSYERATILIGKEMGNIKETLKNLSNELITIFNENKGIISASKKLSNIELKINEIKDMKEKERKIEEDISNLADKILRKEKENREISERLNKIKNSLEYMENIRKKEDIKLKEEEIEKDIYTLKQMIDFRSLSNFFHIFEDRMTIVKLHRDDFLAEFKKDKGSRLLNLLNESKLNSEQIYDKIKQIQDKEEEIKNSRNELKEDQTQPLISESEKINEEIKELKNEKEWAEKKNEGLKLNQNEIFRAIKQELEIMGVDLENQK